jgi:hypothetical protein
MTTITDSLLFHWIIEDACEFRRAKLLHNAAYEEGYRGGVRDTERQERKVLAGEDRND